MRNAEQATTTLGVSLKLYLGNEDTFAWSERVADVARSHPAVLAGDVRLFILPSLPAAAGVLERVDADTVAVGAQDVDAVDRGAYTGAVSGADLRELGLELVEIGHAERRAIFGETDEIVRDKFAASVRHGLIPVLCIGEPDEGSVEDAAAECIRQLDATLGDTDATGVEVILAYEPVWAIGKANPAPAEHVVQVVRALRAAAQQDARLGAVTVIYGGSAQIGTLTALGEDVDGLFLGRFAHNADDLRRMIVEASSRAPERHAR